MRVYCSSVQMTNVDLAFTPESVWIPSSLGLPRGEKALVGRGEDLRGNLRRSSQEERSGVQPRSTHVYQPSVTRAGCSWPILLQPGSRCRNAWSLLPQQGWRCHNAEPARDEHGGSFPRDVLFSHRWLSTADAGELALSGPVTLAAPHGSGDSENLGTRCRKYGILA
jgi:hypothetical protein